VVVVLKIRKLLQSRQAELDPDRADISAAE
jgi:hypothetical protein